MSVATLSRSKPNAPRLLPALGSVLRHVALLAGALVMLLPFLWMISTSLKPADQLFAVPPVWIPRELHFDTYARAMGSGNFGRYALNSLVLAVANTLTNVCLAALAGYAFARLEFPGRRFLFVLVLATLMIPYQVTIIPLFVIIRHIPLFGGNDLIGEGGIGWMNSYWGLIVPGAVGAFGIFLLRQSFQTLPADLEDAARIDGAGEFRIFWQIMFPLALPALATLAIFSFQAGWNAFLWPLLITTTDDMRTVQLGLTVFVQQYSTQWDQLMAATVVATLPMIAAFAFGQRLLVRGIAFTGLKG